MSGAELVTEKLKKREEERKAELTRRKIEKDSVTSAEENSEYFTTNFSKIKSELEQDLQECDSVHKNELTYRFDAITESFQDIKQFLADSTIFLPKFEVRQAQEYLNKLETDIQEKKDQLLPKKKFAFRSKKKVAEKVEMVQSNGDEIKKDGHVELAGCSILDISNQTLLKQGSQIDQLDVALARLSNCIIKLFGAPSTVHAKNLKDCVLLCGPVSSSIFISDCTNCVFVIACQQLRTHSSTDCVFYLHVTSRAIIEDCSKLEFAPYNLEYPNIEKDYQRAGLDTSRNNWNDVDDFNWLASDVHSPNWSVLPEEKRKSGWHGN